MRAGQPVKALVHVSFADLCAMDQGSALQDQWIAGYRARWAAHRYPDGTSQVTSPAGKTIRSHSPPPRPG